MAIESPADLLVFLQEDDFAVEATYTPQGGSPSTIVGIFEDPQASRSLTDRLDITIPQVSFMCRTVDVGDDAESDALVIAGTAYTIRAVMTDGTGMSTLMLEED